MLEKKDVAGAGVSAEIHLCTAIWVGTGNKPGARFQRDLLRDTVARSVDHDCLRDAVMSQEHRKKRFQVLGVPPRRDDNADPQLRFPSVAAQVHCGFFNRRFRARSSARRSDAVRLLIPCLEILSSTGSIDS